MRYLGLGIGHLNAPDFPGDEGRMRVDVLIENDEDPWETADNQETRPGDEEDSSSESESGSAESDLDADEEDMYDM